MLLLLLLLFLFCKLWKIKEACASWLELTWTRRIDYDAVMGEQEPQQHGELLLWLLSENHGGWFLWKKIPGGLKSKQSWKGMKEKKKKWGEKNLIWTWRLHYGSNYLWQIFIPGVSFFSFRSRWHLSSSLQIFKLDFFPWLPPSLVLSYLVL